jgi:hypothetical protein
MELLGDVGPMESHFDLFGDDVSVCTRYVHDLCQMYDRLNWKFILVRLDIVLILMQDRSTVCVECTIGSKIILDTPDGNPM